MRTVEAQLGRDVTADRNTVDHALPDAAAGPAMTPIVECGCGVVFGGDIALSASGLEHVEDAADHSAIIDPRLARPRGRCGRMSAQAASDSGLRCVMKAPARHTQTKSKNAVPIR